ILRAVKLSAGNNQTLLEQATSENERLQGENERLRRQLMKADSKRKVADERLAQAMAVLEKAEKCIAEERRKRAMLEADVAAQQ
ncbi:hypothetical protein AAVH_12072, partial [Aphelenchoides avenae]